MRHRLGQRKLNITDGGHRRALMRGMSNALIREERIKTTVARAKELRRHVEPLITLAKKPSVANRRIAFSRLRDRDNVVKLFDDLGGRYVSRAGGYVRVLKYGFRHGDNAPLALVELTERREKPAAEAASDKAAAKKPTRARKAAKPAAEKAEAAAEATEATEEKQPEVAEAAPAAPEPAAAEEEKPTDKSAADPVAKPSA